MLDTNFVILVPIVIGLVEVAKRSGLATKWSPVLSIFLGIAGAYLVGSYVSADTLLQGIIVGLSASGLYSGVQTTIVQRG